MYPRRWPLCLVAVALAAASAALLVACAEGTDAPELSLAPAGDGSTRHLSRIYRLGVGDKLNINVFGEPSLSGTFEVGATGSVSMPLVGEIRANDRPIEEFRQAVSNRLAQGYLKNPKISVDIVRFKPIYVHGEVKKGGEYDYRSSSRLSDVIAQAGGYTYRAEKGFVLVIRGGEAREFKVRAGSAFEVLPGDNIRVPERFF
jgi:polysaccharide export outer membrane protein